MKSFEHLIALAILVTIATACGNRTNQSNAQEATIDTVVVDTFSSPDLTLYELKGHVNTCKTTSHEATLKDGKYVIKDTKGTPPSHLVFTEQGYVSKDGIFDLTYDEQGKVLKGVNVTDKDMKISIERNKNGYLTSLTCENKKYGMESDQAYKINYKWNDKNQMTAEEFQGWEWSSANHYKYDDKGLRQELTNQSNPDYEVEVDNTSTYIYTKFDDKGNWTERNVEMVSITTNTELGSETSQKSAPEKSYYVEKREIIYF